MNKKHPTRLATTLRGFFHNHLPRTMGVSTHTVHSYRDSLKLLLLFCARDNGGVERLCFTDISVERIIAFLTHLEANRGNCAGTRNNRLAAIHCFFRYVAGVAPEHIELAQRVLAIPFKKAGVRLVEYFEFTEMEAVLGQINRQTEAGQRDYALLIFMFNTGVRAQEVCDIRANDLCLSPPFSAHIIGKGRKERICPLWTATAHMLRDLLEKRRVDPREPIAVFTNRHGSPLTRFGIRFILTKYAQMAAATCPTLQGKRLHPHSMRHSTAVHLLKSGVDLVSIASWLGHVSVETTGKYVSIDLDMKREAIKKAAPPNTEGKESSKWRDDTGLLEWLESL